MGEQQRMFTDQQFLLLLIFESPVAWHTLSEMSV